MIIEIKKRGDNMDFGRKMLEFRAKHHLTQKQLADIIGVEMNTISRTETEKSQPTKRNAIIFENKMKEWEDQKNV